MNALGSFPRTPLFKSTDSSSGRALWVKDEAACPTGTFKDRLGWALARQLARSPVEDLLITCITLGNTLRSVAFFLNKLPASSIKPRILGLFPLRFSERIIGPDTHGQVCRGADVIALCEAEGALAAETDLESGYLDEGSISHLARSLAPPFLHHRDISYGIGEQAYAPILEEALDDLADPPAVVLVPVGAGVLFDECVEVVESRGLTTTVVGVSVTEPESIADKIYGYYSPYYQHLRDVRSARHPRYDRHPVLSVTDGEIIRAVQWAAQQEIEAEPSAVAALVPYLSNYQALPAGDILWINTGNGIVHGSAE